MAFVAQKDLKELLDDIVGRMAAEIDRGAVASYIPELSKVDINHFGIAVAPVEGEPVVSGDADVPFSIQSISKVFSLTLALERVGVNLWTRVGREPSGDPFNSIVLLEKDRGVPRNPLINAGAIVVADVLLEGRKPEESIEEIIQFCRRQAADDRIGIDLEVAKSETRSGDRNRALAYFMASEGNLKMPVDQVLQVYFHQCSVNMTCRQLAMAGRYLAADGRTSGGEAPTVTPMRARRINSLMMSCGLYDASGEFAFRVGIPAKSGVGGGVLGIVPGVASVAAWSPGLDEHGNSLLAVKALEELIRGTGWSVFGPHLPQS